MKLDAIGLSIASENKAATNASVIIRSNLDVTTAPFEKWNPEPCMNTHFKINAHGEWFHNEQRIRRLALIQLFSKVLLKSREQYFLKTPTELIDVQVDDCPFIVVSWSIEERGDEASSIVMETNVGEKYEVNSTFYLSIDNSVVKPEESLESPITLNVRNGFKARLHRNVYYQLMERIVEVELSPTDTSYEIVSGSYRFKCD